jgi:putative ABC transport system ATP-binding protein
VRKGNALILRELVWSADIPAPGPIRSYEEALLKIERLTKVFHPGEVNEVTAISNVSLDVPEGQFLVIIGGNGSGKSTLLNLIAGALLPDAGEIFLNGTNVTKVPEHVRAGCIGRVFQDPLLGTSAGLTIEENFSLAASRGEFRGLGPSLGSKLRSQIRDRLALLDMGLEDRMKANVGLLSGGQRQAITILMAVFKRPSLLLLDEHTAALDPRASKKIVELTRSIVREERLTTLMITHNLAQALDTGDRTIMMTRGAIKGDLQGDRRRQMTVHDLMNLFWAAGSSGEDRNAEAIM